MLGNVIIAWVVSYFLGAIPFGLLVVWVFSGKDVRKVESGRTGGTNAMRAAGVIAGLLTALMDVLKGVATRWVVAWLAPGIGPWVAVIAALLAILGHNYSIFLLEKHSSGKLILKGGAGGATAFGGAIALWPSNAYIIFPIAAMVFLFVGYASLTTISISVATTIIFIIRAANGAGPWEYIAYGIISLIIVLYALRPNIKRLREGSERLTGLRGYWTRKKLNKNPSPAGKG